MTARSTPDPAALSGLLAGVGFVAGVAGMMAWSDAPYPRPGSDAETIQRFFTRDPRPARVGVAGQLLSAAALARFTGSVVALARRSGSRSVATTALLGGAAAVAALTTSAGYTAALTTARAQADDAAIRLHRRAFLAGGAAHGVGFGLLTGALGIAGRRSGTLSEPVTGVALASALASLLSPLSLVVPQALLLIPVGRFAGLVVSGIAGVRLAAPPDRPVRRHGRLGGHGPVV